MNFIEEINYDMNFSEPRIVIKDRVCMVENVKAIIMIGRESLTVEAKKKYVTINCSEYEIKEIKDGRLLIEGKIQGVEIMDTSSSNKGRGLKNR